MLNFFCLTFPLFCRKLFPEYECNGAAVGSKNEKCSGLVFHMAGKVDVLITTLNTDFHCSTCWSSVILHLLQDAASNYSYQKRNSAYYRAPDINKQTKKKLHLLTLKERLQIQTAADACVTHLWLHLHLLCTVA